MTPLAKTTLEQWAVLAAVVDEGGFAQAALAMSRSQSAVSYAVARLQESLDLPLLVVEGRKSVLTAHGRTLLARARGLLKDLDALEREARSLKQGWESEIKLVVDAAFPRDRLLRIVADLQTTCPSTQIAVARPDHALFQLQRDLTTEDLVRHVQAVVRDSGTSNPRDDGWLGAERRFTVSSMEASLATLLAGLSYAWLPEHMLVDQLKSGALRRLPLVSGATREVSLYIVLPHAQFVGPATRAAMDAFRRR
jgi:DNA-binding transcriptional LysR family regulator